MARQPASAPAWRLSGCHLADCHLPGCHLAHINQWHPARLSLLFEIDTCRNIRNGFRYSLICQAGRQ